jgi:hypothetical protein
LIPLNCLLGQTSLGGKRMSSQGAKNAWYTSSIPWTFFLQQILIPSNLEFSLPKNTLWYYNYPFLFAFSFRFGRTFSYVSFGYSM